MTRPTQAVLPSAGRMEQAANQLGLRELVVKRHGVLRRQYVHSDLPFFQKNQRLARHMLLSSKPVMSCRCVLNAFVVQGPVQLTPPS